MTTSYERIGGHGTMRTAVAVFYRRAVADPALAHYFEGVDVRRLRAHQAAFLSAALDGPQAFAGRGLTDAHRGLAITGPAFDAMVEHLGLALTDVGVSRETVAEVLETVRAHRGAIVQGEETDLRPGSIG
ncbi:MAG: group 1 truncated hemoglobin [Herbiconiux sp.]|uniref:group I truncated hemoglobin n=1 Tax=Herbiconiux sp. TaxID=1871186 RepID=UPI00121EDEC9|nr:group 1 truncated hemoglobin [Herbiconiux sp.]TAJ48432.1 MAG: group 1 truncated hemoglobin [Herbiconiux sp.]